MTDQPVDLMAALQASLAEAKREREAWVHRHCWQTTHSCAIDLGHDDHGPCCDCGDKPMRSDR